VHAARKPGLSSREDTTSRGQVSQPSVSPYFSHSPARAVLYQVGPFLFQVATFLSQAGPFLSQLARFLSQVARCLSQVARFLSQVARCLSQVARFLSQVAR